MNANVLDLGELRLDGLRLGLGDIHRTGVVLCSNERS